MKKPENDPAFVSFVEKVEKMERDVEAVNHHDEMANEAIMTKIKDKMPDTVIRNCDCGGLGRREQSVFHKVHEASSSKSKSCVVTGTALVAHSDSGSESDSKKPVSASGQMLLMTTTEVGSARKCNIIFLKMMLVTSRFNTEKICMVEDNCSTLDYTGPQSDII